MTAEEAFLILQKEITILRSRQALSEGALHHLQEIASINFGFGFYDPRTEKDCELARMLEPHIQALKTELNF